MLFPSEEEKDMVVFAHEQECILFEALKTFVDNGPYRYKDRTCVFCGGLPSYHEFPCTWIEAVEMLP